MSKEKQIEELAEILRKACDATPNGKCMSKPCCVCRAETVIRAGYRKQSEGEWVIKDLNDPFYESKKAPHCSNCGYMSFITWDYCPKCGAKMKGGAE